MVKSSNSPTANNHVSSPGKEVVTPPKKLPVLPTSGLCFSADALRADRRKRFG